MEKKKIERLTEEQIDYNVLNALNLMNEELGESYIATQFNPFDEGFKLEEGFVIERYNNACIKKEILSPDFISYGVSETKKAFENSLSNLTEILAGIDEKLSEYTLEESLRKTYNKLRIYVMCRIQLTSIFLAKLKIEKNTLKMYQDLESLDWELSEYFNDCYDENFNTRIAISAFIELIINSKTTKKSIEDKKLIEKAKSIIANNNMKQNIELPKPQNEQIVKETKSDKPVTKNVEKNELSNKQNKEVTNKAPTNITPKETKVKDEGKTL